jgi:molybdopterin molybdotransferase
VLSEDLAPRRAASVSFAAVCSTRDAGTVTSYGPPASHHLRWLASASCLLEIDGDVTEVAAGSPVHVGLGIGI